MLDLKLIKYIEIASLKKWVCRLTDNTRPESPLLNILFNSVFRHLFTRSSWFAAPLRNPRPRLTRESYVLFWYLWRATSAPSLGRLFIYPSVRRSVACVHISGAAHAPYVFISMLATDDRWIADLHIPHPWPVSSQINSAHSFLNPALVTFDFRKRIAP